MESKRFMNANDVSTYLEISVPMAYKIIRRMNDELRKQGYITIAGKVSKTYFEERFYGSSMCG